MKLALNVTTSHPIIRDINPIPSRERELYCVNPILIPEVNFKKLSKNLIALLFFVSIITILMHQEKFLLNLH